VEIRMLLDSQSWSWFPVIASLIGGGAMGALISEWFRRRHGRTHPIPLIELVNRNPLLYELRGIKMIRIDGSQAGVGEVTNIRHYQLLLRNTSHIHLRDAEIQIDFKSAEDIVPWVSRPAKSKTALHQQDPATVETPWAKSFRWKIPQFPHGDSVEFGFQVINPSSEDFDYEPSLYSAHNVMIKRTKVDPETEGSGFSERLLAHVTVLAVLLGAVGVIISVRSIHGLEKLLSEKQQASASLDRREIEKTVVQSEHRLRLSSQARHFLDQWSYTYRVRNEGNRAAWFAWKDANGSVLLEMALLAPGQDAVREMILSDSPALVESEILFGAKSEGLRSRLQVYGPAGISQVPKKE